ncbi:hypothetical protein VTK26DRAFT_2879 [Humicola hyalothermophila]
MTASTAAQPPAIPPRPSRSQDKQSPPMVPPRPANKRIQRSISPNPDRFAPSPLNESTFPTQQPAARHADPIPRSTSVELPSVGEEGKEYEGLAEELSSAKEGEDSASPEHTRTVGADVKLHAPKPSLPASSAKRRVMTVTRTDSERAAAFGIGRANSGDDSAPALPSNRSLKKKASTTSQLSATESHLSDEHGIPEIGMQVPMYPNAGDVQAPSPAPGVAADAARAKHHSRKPSSHGNLPPGSYGLHGHGVGPQDKLEKAYYEKHPDLLKKEHVPHHYDRPNDFSLSSNDLNKIVKETASRGGLGTKDYAGTPSEQVGWQALEESTSRVASPGLSPAADGPSSVSPGSATPDSEKEGRRISAIGEVIHVEEPHHRRSVMFSDTESVGGEELERPYTAPILADDEIAKDPSGLAQQPAVEPRAFDLEEPISRPTSRPASLHKETPFELRSTPLEDVKEYEPLFNDDEKPEVKQAAKEEKPKKYHTRRFPSADIWEDAPSSAYHTAEVSTPELFDEQEKPSPAIVPPPREGETPAQAFARHQEELAEKEVRELGPEGFIPARKTEKPIWVQHQKHLAGEAPAARPSSQQRFPSRDVWEDTPDSLKLETTVSTPQRDDETASPSPADNNVTKPEIPERPKTKPAVDKKPPIPERPKPRQASADDKPAVPDRPKPQIPARPTKSGPPALETTDATTATTTAPPPPRPKPAVPARPAMGSKIAALQAGFMNDLNRRLQLGPQAPPSAARKQEKTEEGGEENSTEEVKEKVPLSDARKGRARGPQRRAPTSAAKAKAAAANAAEGEEGKGKEDASATVVFGFVAAKRVFEIDPEDENGRVCAGEGGEAVLEGKVVGERSSEVKDKGGEKEEETVEEEEKKGQGVGERISAAANAVVGAVSGAVAGTVGSKEEEGGEKKKEVDGKKEDAGEKEERREEDKKAESEGKVEAEPKDVANTKPDAPVEAEQAKPTDSDSEHREEATETKSLVSNMAGETLVTEEVKKDDQHEAVEPVNIVQN